MEQMYSIVNFVSPDRYQYRLQLSTDSQFCIQLGTPILTPTTRIPFIPWLYFIYQCTGQIIPFQMMPPLRSFDDVDEKERGQKKTADLRAMTTLGPRTLATLGITHVFSCINICRVPRKLFEHEAVRPSVQTSSEGPGKC